MVTIRIPVPRGLVPNLLGLFGLIAITVAVGGLTGNWWWSVLIGGVFSVGMAVLTQLQAAPAQVQASTEDAPTRPVSRIAAVV